MRAMLVVLSLALLAPGPFRLHAQEPTAAAAIDAVVRARGGYRNRGMLVVDSVTLRVVAGMGPGDIEALARRLPQGAIVGRPTRDGDCDDPEERCRALVLLSYQGEAGGATLTAKSYGVSPPGPCMGSYQGTYAVAVVDGNATIASTSLESFGTCGPRGPVPSPVVHAISAVVRAIEADLSVTSLVVDTAALRASNVSPTDVAGVRHLLRGYARLGVPEPERDCAAEPAKRCLRVEVGAVRWAGATATVAVRTAPVPPPGRCPGGDQVTYKVQVADERARSVEATERIRPACATPDSNGAPRP